MRQLLLLPPLLALAACGTLANIDARNDMMHSKAVYKTCLAQNAANPYTCQSSRLAYEADLKAYRLTISGIKDR